MTTEMLDSIVSPHSQELPNASSALKLFENPQFRVRVIMRCADPWFVASDACDCLALSNVSKALSDLDDDDKLKLTKDELDTLTSSEGIKCSVDARVQLLNLVSESGLYELIMRSRKPDAKAFKRWVTHEVLPSIRKTGGYSVAQPTIFDYARALIAEKERSDALEAQNKALTAERDEAVRTKTQYQSNLAAQMSGRVGGLTTALNRVKLENDRLKGDRLTKEDVFIIMNTQGVSFTLKTVKDVIRESLNTISEYLDEPFPKIKLSERTDANGKTFDVTGFVYTRKTVQAFFEYVENNPMGWQARNRKFILNEWLNHHMTIPA